MKRIEFLGACGVGKTTLLRCALRSRSHKDEWMTLTEAEVRIARGLRCADLHPAWRKAMWLALKLPFPPRGRQALARTILQQFDTVVFDAMPRWTREMMNLQIRLLAGAADGCSTPEGAPPQYTITDGLIKAKAIAFCLHSLMRLARLETLGTDLRLVGDDGGILQNQLPTADATLLGAMAREGSFSGLMPSGVVFCDLAPDELFRRRKARIAAGSVQFMERNLTDDNLRESCRSMALRMAKKVGALQQIGIPVLTVPMAEPPARNVPTVLAFIQ